MRSVVKRREYIIAVSLNVCQELVHQIISSISIFAILKWRYQVNLVE